MNNLMYNQSYKLGNKGISIHVQCQGGQCDDASFYLHCELFLHFLRI